MPIVKLTLNDEYYEKLKIMAQAEQKSIQDFIRDTIFQIDTIFTLEEAINRIHQKEYKIGDEFELPDVYGEDWTIERGPAGVFGKKFFNYVNANPQLGIEFKDMGKYGRRAVYKIVKNIK